ncbi:MULTISPECIES: transposase, partial [unclassified Streptomyces]|uniref:transposase n=1 Tax=unclassified Streptomyces TaxID=2593676 RepID=UPI0035DE2AA0
ALPSCSLSAAITRSRLPFDARLSRSERQQLLTVRPAGKQSLAAAQKAGGRGRSRWDGVLPIQTLLAEWPENPPAGTPVADLVRWAKTRWRIEHDYRELKHGLGLDHFEGRTWRGWHHHVTLVTAAQAFLTLRRLDPRAHTPA